ncbi:MAG: hypothetical protein ACSHX0_12410 [Akkermansiaceae bacterium]
MELQPVEKDPVQLRRTAIILVVIMIVGATFVLLAYKRHEGKQDPNRPPISAKITKNLAAKNQYNTLVSLAEFEGAVWFVAPICVSQLDENKHAIAMIQELEEHYRENENVRFAFLSIEGVDQGVGPEQLAETAKALGFDESSKVWFLTTGETKKQRGFIKDQLRLGIISERKLKDGETGGKWQFPSQIALIDRGMHLRQRYDFKEVYEHQVRAERELAKRPELKEVEGFENVLYAVENLKNTLYSNTKFVLDEITTGSIK